jgi:hypothetical protein
MALLGSARPPADAMRVRGRVRAPLLRDELRYSTPELLATERAIVETAHDGPDAQVGIAEPATVEAAHARRPSFPTSRCRWCPDSPAMGADGRRGRKCRDG